MAPLLQTDGVSMSFGGVHALSGVSFELQQGETLGLIGPNGAGKTTMFNCITGVLPGYRGEIRYDGRDLRYLKPHQRARLKIARTFQNLELFDELSALDNLVLPLDAFSQRSLIGDLLRLPTTVFGERTAQETARCMLHFIGLGDYADTPAGDLPVGLQRRLEIGRALCLEPRLLLLDEPASGLDARETAQLARLLASVRARFKVTILLVDHDMALIMRICNRIYVLDYGRIIAEGTPEQIRDDPQVVRAYLGEPDATDADSTEPTGREAAELAVDGAGR
jgi:branched-chain amino acid transport system ATP-binding protein